MAGNKNGVIEVCAANHGGLTEKTANIDIDTPKVINEGKIEMDQGKVDTAEAGEVAMFQIDSLKQSRPEESTKVTSNPSRSSSSPG